MAAGKLLRSCTGVLCTVAAASAAAQGWVIAGPEGGSITALAADAVAHRTVYAAARGGGVFVSRDGGHSWSDGNHGLTDPDVTGLAVDPTRGGTLFVATRTGGVYRSTDGAASWTRTAAGLERGDRFASLTSIAVDPGDPSRLLAGSNETTAVYRSTDGGLHWAPSAGGLPDFAWITGFTFDRASPATVWARAQPGLWRSDDSGVTWSEVAPDVFDGLSVVGVAIPPDVPDAVYVATVFELWKSSDGGTTFERLPDLPPRSPAASDKLADDTTTYVRWMVWGVVWQIVDPPPGPAAAPSAAGGDIASELLPANRGIEFRLSFEGPKRSREAATTGTSSLPLFLATDAGLFVTRDDGEHWQVLNDGLPTLELTVLAETDPAHPRLLAGSDGSGVFALGESGPWQSASHGLEAAIISAWAPSDGGVLLAGTRGAGVLRSGDGGRSWHPANRGGLTDSWIYGLTVDPSDPARVYAATDVGTFRTSDRGASWTELATGLPYGLSFTVAVDPTDPMTLYAAGNDGVRRSRDGGETWQPANAGLEGRQVRSLVLDPTDSRALLAGVYGAGVWKSGDRGASWTASNGAGGFLEVGIATALAADPGTPGTFYAGLDGHGVWRTSDAGASWQHLAEGLVDPETFAEASVSAIVVDPSDPARIWIAAAASDFSAVAAPTGILFSDDGGAHWRPHAGGGVTAPCLSLVLDAGPPARLLAGTAGRGGRLFGPPLPPPPPHRAAGRAGPG